MPLKNGKPLIFSDVADVMTIEEYYYENPDKRPQPQRFFKFKEDNQNKESAYQKLYSSHTYCERAVVDFTRIIEERKFKGLPYHKIEDLLAYVQNKLSKILCNINLN